MPYFQPASHQPVTLGKWHSVTPDFSCWLFSATPKATVCYLQAANSSVLIMVAHAELHVLRLEPAKLQLCSKVLTEEQGKPRGYTRGKGATASACD